MSRPHSIFWRYFGVFAVAALVPIAAMAVQGYHCARRAISADRLHLMRQLSSLRRDQIESGIRERARAVGILSDLPELREAAAAALAGPAGQARLQPLLEGYGKKWVAFESAAIFDPAGRPLAMVGPASPGELWDEEVERHLQASAGSGSGLPVPGPIRAREPAHPSMRVTAAVVDGRGKLLCALVASIDLGDTVASILGLSDREDAVRSYLLGTDGTPLSAIPGGETAIKVALAQPPTRYSHQGCERCSTGSCHYGEYAAPDGVQVIGACYPSSDRKWMVVSESPVEAVLSNLNSFVLFSATTSGAGLLAMVIAAGFLGRRISRPIRSVAETARRIAAGDLSSRAGYAKNDDVGALVSAFNSLVDGLLSSRAEIGARNRELESALSQLSVVRDRLVQTEAMSAVGRVAASLVHEIRNPLSSVKMNLQILSRPLGSDPLYAEHARIALDQVERLEGMLTDLLDFGRPLELRPQRVKLADCVARAVGDVRGRARERGVEIDSRIDGAELEGDPARISQALLNLLANAVDASPPGGRVEVVDREIEKDGGRWVACEVRDQGPGIRPEHREAIFDPFFTTKEGGTGLGLSMARKIATLHGGRVEVESEPGRPTVARLVLPGE